MQGLLSFLITRVTYQDAGLLSFVSSSLFISSLVIVSLSDAGLDMFCVISFKYVTIPVHHSGADRVAQVKQDQPADTALAWYCCVVLSK